MKSSKTFNNISEGLKKQIPKLKPGQSVVFKMLNGVPNIEPDEKERSKDPILYPKVQLMTQFRIFDTEKDDFVDVGCVDSWAGDNPTSFRCYVAGGGNGQAQTPSRFQGKFELKGGNVQDEELYEILWLSPQRKGSPCPDSNVEVIFEIMDLKSETTTSLNRFDVLKRAMKMADDITEAKAREVMAGLNQPVYQDKEVLMAKVKDLARDKPDVFIKTYEDALTPVITSIKEALLNGALVYDIATGKATMGGVVITTIKANSADNFVAAFAGWLNTAENGKEVLKNIQKGKEVVTK